MYNLKVSVSYCCYIAKRFFSFSYHELLFCGIIVNLYYFVIFAVEITDFKPVRWERNGNARSR